MSSSEKATAEQYEACKPCRSTVQVWPPSRLTQSPIAAAANADARMNRVRAHFVDVTVDVNGGMPRHTAVGGARNASDMNIGQKHSTVRSCGHRTNPKRRPNELTVYQRRACVPGVSSRNSFEAAKRIDLAVFAEAEDTSIVRPEIDRVADYHEACEVPLAGSDRFPLRPRRYDDKASVRRRWRVRLHSDLAQELAPPDRQVRWRRASLVNTNTPSVQVAASKLALVI